VIGAGLPAGVIVYPARAMEVSARLLDLQALDLAIDRLQARRSALEEGTAIAGARAAADEAERTLGELRLQLDALDRDETKLEHEIDSLTQKAAAEQRRMSDGSVANARELESIGREVENLQRRKIDREDALLEVLEEREGIERRGADADAKLRELRDSASSVASSSEVELGEVTAELEARTGERRELAPALDPELLTLYDDLRAHKKGVGAAALVDGVCQGCHEALSAVELDRVRRADGVPRCEHCRRILVL
jgi:predicted  nucleic acid-binding Zn-ribbon protein